MSSAGGLSRRRVPTSSTLNSANNGGGGDDPPSTPSSSNRLPISRDSSSSNLPNSTHSGTAFSGGNKIAYDPRDLELSSTEAARIGGSPPHLTLLEEVLLLGLKDKQGYLSFWNDNVSYALRGCILIELALRRRIGVVREPGRKRLPLSERLVEVIDDRMTGETILDEALRIMKGQQDGWGAGSSGSVGGGAGGNTLEGLGNALAGWVTGTGTAGEKSGGGNWGSSWSSYGYSPSNGQAGGAGGGEKLSVNSWIDLLSGETWSLTKLSFQLKQVRERLAKGLVDKGVLRTEKRNFLLFDMATHPVSDIRVKESLIRRVNSLLGSGTRVVPKEALSEEGTQCRVMRTVCLVCAAYCASVLDNAFGRLGYEEREAAFSRADEILAEFSVWPYGSYSSDSSTSTPRKRAAASAGTRIATGSSTDPARESILGLVDGVRKEAVVTPSPSTGGGATGPLESGGLEDDLGFELIAGVMEVLGKLDSLL